MDEPSKVSIKRILVIVGTVVASLVAAYFILPSNPGLAVVVGWGCFSIPCAYVALEKGRSLVAWFLLGFLFQAAAMVVIARIRPKYECSEI